MAKLNLYKIYRGLVAGDGKGTPARTAAEGLNANADAIANEMVRIDESAEKVTNKATNLDAPNDVNFPTTKAVADELGGIEANANLYTDNIVAAYQPKSEKGQPGGYVGTDPTTNKINPIHLPAGVDEVVEVTDFASLPATGAAATIYITTDNNKTYRWGGSVYAEIQAAPGTTDEVVEGTQNKYFTEARVRATLLTGINTMVGGAITAGDSILAAFGKLQAQINSLTNSLGTKLDKGGYTGTAQDIINHANTKETPTGAQTKADEALQAAKDYYDGLTGTEFNIEGGHSASIYTVSQKIDGGNSI